MVENPTLFFISGPIGVGKSTLAVSLLNRFNNVDFEFISSDLYYYLYFKNNKDSENNNYQKAKSLRDYKLKKAVEQRRSFVWESVLNDKKVSFLESISKQGYNLIGLFIGTDDLGLLVRRVKKRACDGWYNVPEAKIKNRYYIMMDVLKRLASLSKMFIMVNSNTEGFNLSYYQSNGDMEFADETCSWVKRFLHTESLPCTAETIIEIRRKMIMYKLIALDCDGTLLNSKKEITERTVTAIRAANSFGIKIVLASARPFYRLKPFTDKLGIASSDQYSIAFNGGLIVNNTETNVLFTGGFTTEEVKELVTFGSDYDTAMFLYSKDGIISNVNDEKYKKKNPDVSFNVVDLATVDFTIAQIYKIAYVNSPEETLALRARLPQTLYEKFEISSSVPQFVEFVSKGITKSGALEYIGRKLGISPEEMAAFGDQDNDIPMLRYVGLSIAMGNATAEVKSYAKITTASNDEDGVAIAIEKNIFQKC